MTSRVSGTEAYTFTYDVDNRLTEVHKDGAVVAGFGYDGDGRMVSATVGITTTYYVGNYFEEVNGTDHSYYYHGGKRIAMRDGIALYWPRSVSPSVWRGCSATTWAVRP